MADIYELNRKRCHAEAYMKALGMLNTPVDAEEQPKAQARYRLAYDAWWQAQKEYQDAIAGMSADQLIALAK